MSESIEVSISNIYDKHVARQPTAEDLTADIFDKKREIQDENTVKVRNDGTE